MAVVAGQYCARCGIHQVRTVWLARKWPTLAVVWAGTDDPQTIAHHLWRTLWCPACGELERRDA